MVHPGDVLCSAICAHLTPEHTRFIMESRAWCKPQLPILKTYGISVLNRFLGTFMLWNTHTCDRGQFEKPWQDTQCTMTVTSAVGGWANVSCALHPRKEEWEPAHMQEMFPNIPHEDVLSCLKERNFFFPGVSEGISPGCGEGVLCPATWKKTVALCPGIDNFTRRTLWGEVWCERLGSPKLSPGLMA